LQHLKIRPVRTREHFLFNLLTFSYFRRSDVDVRFMIESGPLSAFVVAPFVLFSEAYFLRQRRYFIILDQRVVGILALQEDGETLNVSSLAVSPEYRRIGIATYLLNYGEAIAKVLCKNALELSVLKTNRPALRLYGKHSFRIERERGRSLVLRRQIRKP
jgi:ribosomal protein S18 acetylase RimI-like enzyme